MREEETKFGRRVYYDTADVPAVLDEAREMVWQPYIGWRARLRLSPFRSGPEYLLDFFVRGRWVFTGTDDDAARLLDAFQTFLDEHRDHVDGHLFRRRQYVGCEGEKPCGGSGSSTRHRC